MEFIQEPLLPKTPLMVSSTADLILPVDQVYRHPSPSQSGRASWINALRAGAVLIGLAGFSYGVLLASVLIRMAPITGFVGSFGGNPRPHPPQHYHDIFLTVPCNNSAASNLKRLTAVPHVAGTKENMDTATFVKAKFEEAGLPAHYADYHVLLSYPVHRKLSILSPTPQTLSIAEAAQKVDPYSRDPRVIDTFHAYSPSGNVTGEVVYANYGRTEDYEKLASMGINCTGAIVISRYGKIFRGDKVANAAMAGAVASLVYSDPKDYAGRGDDGVYPEAQWLPPSGVQRGSIAPFKGDPLTPGWPSVEDCEQLDIDDKEVHLPPIPSLPISYGDALPILSALKGETAPREWWGALNLSEYRLGKGPVKVNLELEMNLTVTPIRNVHAVIRGAEEPDRYVVLGNHRDAWTFGAVDPNSGTAALIEVARGLRVLLEAGWRPRRTIVLANWDAEEYALIGSSEWVEENEDLLGARAVAYLNVDSGVAGAGILSAGACPQLDDLLLSSAKRVKDPREPELSLYDTWLAEANVTRNLSTVPKVSRLGGAGTDYAGFLQHIGVASINMEIEPAGSGGYPMYHSVYDNFHWMTNFGDPGFHYHVAIAAVWGLVGLVLADSPILPFDYTAYAAELQNYAAALDITLADAEAPSSLSTAPIHGAVSRFSAAAHGISAEAQALRKKVESSWPGLDLTGDAGGGDPRIRELNDRLMLAERAFIAPEGIPGRPWFRHLVYAPSEDNGYGTSVFPGIVDAIGRAKRDPEGAGWRAVQHEVHRVARSIQKASNVLRGSLS